MKFENFKIEMRVLSQLFKNTDVGENYLHLKRVYEETERHWNNNLNYIHRKNIKVKFLLIAEAPPGKKDESVETVKYFYNPESVSHQSYLINVARCFFPGETVRCSSMMEKQNLLNKVSDMGFILIDSLPFAMNYSKERKRSSPHYKKLIEVCAGTYVKYKLNECRVPWSSKEQVKVAFSVRKTGEQAIKYLPPLLPFKSNIESPGQAFTAKDFVGVDGSNFLAWKPLRKIFKLDYL